MTKKHFTYLVLFFLGIGLGLWVKENGIVSNAIAQESRQTSEKQLLRGEGRANTSWKVPNHTKEPFTILTSPQSSFSIIPKDKNYVLTDVVFHPQQSVHQTVTVNISLLDPTKQYVSILFQTKVNPNESETVNFCSGYVVPAGYSLVAYTGAGYQPEQYVSISFSGYLEDAR